MSAYIVEPKEIAAVAKKSPTQPLEVARILATANIESMIARYGDSSLANNSAYIAQCIWATHTAPDITATEAISLIDCINYQSCEVDDWHETQACKILVALKSIFEPLVANEKKQQEEHAKAEEQAEYAKQYEYLQIKYPRLVRAKDDRNAAQKNMRKLLKAEFPSVTFTVRKSSGQAITVSWDDGATDEEVSAIVNQFKCGRFDSYTDCRYSVSTAFTDLFGYADYVFTYRNITESAKRQIISEVCSRFGYEPISLDEYNRAMTETAQTVREFEHKKSFIK